MNGKRNTFDQKRTDSKEINDKTNNIPKFSQSLISAKYVPKGKQNEIYKKTNTINSNNMNVNIEANINDNNKNSPLVSKIESPDKKFNFAENINNVDKYSNNNMHAVSNDTKTVNFNVPLINTKNENIKLKERNDNNQINNGVTPDNDPFYTTFFSNASEVNLNEQTNKNLYENNNNNNVAKSIYFPQSYDINEINFDEKSVKRSFSIMEDDYLAIEDIEMSNIGMINNNFKNKVTNLMDLKDLLNLKKTIDKCDLVFKVETPNCYMASPINSLDLLVENAYAGDIKRKDSMLQNVIALNEVVWRWRKIGGDGNCYYRSIMFGFFENIIINGDLNLLMYYITDIKRVLDNPEIIKMCNTKALEIKRELVIKILLIIYFALNQHNTNDKSETFTLLDFSDNKDQIKSYKPRAEDIQKAYEIFIKSINSCRHFDYALILYFRFIMFEFINENKDKLYTKDFSVKIGNLLPSEYETEAGEFLWDKFFKEYLLKMHQDAEKIVIYLTPFLLKVDVKILVYDFGSNFMEQLKIFECYIPNKSAIVLLYKKSHYDLIYEKNYFDKFVRWFSGYVNLNENLKIINDKSIDEMRQKLSLQKEKEKKILEAAYINTSPNKANISTNTTTITSNQNDLVANKANDKKIISINSPVLLSNNSNSNDVSPIRKNGYENDLAGTHEKEEIFKSMLTPSNINAINRNVTSHDIKRGGTPTNNNTIIQKINSEIHSKFKMQETININTLHKECRSCRGKFIPNINFVKECDSCFLNEVKSFLLGCYLNFLTANKLVCYDKNELNILLENYDKSK